MQKRLRLPMGSIHAQLRATHESYISNSTPPKGPLGKKAVPCRDARCCSQLPRAVQESFAQPLDRAARTTRAHSNNTHSAQLRLHGSHVCLGPWPKTSPAPSKRTQIHAKPQPYHKPQRKKERPSRCHIKCQAVTGNPSKHAPQAASRIPPSKQSPSQKPITQDMALQQDAVQTHASTKPQWMSLSLQARQEIFTLHANVNGPGCLPKNGRRGHITTLTSCSRLAGGMKTQPQLDTAGPSRTSPLPSAPSVAIP